MVDGRADALGTGIPQYTDRLVAALDGEDIEIARLATAGRAYAAERAWPRIAAAHAAVYREVAGSR